MIVKENKQIIWKIPISYIISQTDCIKGPVGHLSSNISDTVARNVK